MSQDKGISDRRLSTRGARIFFFAWLLVPACVVPPTAAVIVDPALGGIQEVLVAEYGAEVALFPDSPEAVERLAGRQVLVFMASEPTIPVLPVDEPTKVALRSYVERGGRLLLLGYATRIAYELGFESTPPDRFEPYRWGLDQRTLLGEYRYGIRMVSGRAPDLVTKLREEPRGHVYLLGGGELVEVQSCHWEGYWPRDGEVLAQLSRTRDGEPADLDPVVLTRWTAGRGVVLGYGSLPEPWRGEKPVSTNAVQFLRNAVRVAHGTEPTSVALCVSGAPEEKPAELVLPPASRREIPGQILASHWGWQVGLNYLHDDPEPLGPKQIVEEVMLPSWRAGADLLDLHLPDLEQGYPLAWRADDRLARPESFWGGRFWPSWSADSLQELAREAHARGMLVQTWLAPSPVRSGNRVDQLAAIRWFGRELLDLRTLGRGALDGIGVEDWFRDPRGFTVAALQDYHPGMHLYSTDGGAMPGSVPVVDANRGRPLGLNAAGISESWREDVLGMGFPAAMLDSRSRRPSVTQWGDDHAFGGGSYGDWIVTQANDFVRSRRNESPALWWQSFNPATMDASTLAYVHGVSMDPIKAAVAGRLWATGTGGYRELLSSSVPRVQTGFGAEARFDASTHFLQNNHFRLHGTGGALLIDPGGLARFRVGESGTRVLAQEFMSTRIFGGRPNPVELRAEEIELLGTRRRGESGYADVVSIRGTERGAGAFPEILALDDAPRWPGRVDLHFRAGLGQYELDIELRGVTGSGVMELRRDGELVEVFGFRADRQERHVVPFPVARSGDRQLTLEVVDGGSVSVETMRLLRVGDVAAEGFVEEMAGHRASLAEWTSSSYHADRWKITTLADLPGFVLSIDYDRVSRSMQIERDFGFLHHRLLKLSTNEEGTENLRRPFILASDRADIPDLAVVPVTMARYDQFVLTPEGLRLESHPRAYDSLEVGFMFLDDTVDQASALGHLAAMFAEIHTPHLLELSSSGPAVVTSDSPIDHVRALKVHNPWGTPYMVRENGWWIHRGAQPARGGGEWLRIYQRPGDQVLLLAGPDLLTRTRPGPGALHTVALGDPEPDRVTARVLQLDPLYPAPAVTMADPFDEVLVNGQPWSYFDGATVYLPRRPGDYRLETRTYGTGPAPHLVRTRAEVLESYYDPGQRILTIRTAAADDRPGDLPYTALIAGPEPTSLEGCVRVPENELSHRDDAHELRATAKGVIVRFRPGTMRIAY